MVAEVVFEHVRVIFDGVDKAPATEYIGGTAPFVRVHDKPPHRYRQRPNVIEPKTARGASEHRLSAWTLFLTPRDGSWRRVLDPLIQTAILAQLEKRE